VGPNNFTWYIVGLTISGFMAFAIVVGLLVGLIKCLRRNKKVTPSGSSSDMTKVGVTPMNQSENIPLD
jgi:hypothetical protein